MQNKRLVPLFVENSDNGFNFTFLCLVVVRFFFLFIFWATLLEPFLGEKH